MSLQAARMDEIYRRQRHIYDLTRKYYLLGRDRLIDELAPPRNGHVLEVGCGTGRNLIVAARAWPEAGFHGMDISSAMLRTAQSAIARAGLADRIGLARGDATAFNPRTLFGVDGFDRIFLSYTLSMIPRWRGALEAAACALAPGGRLHVVDFGQQERLPPAFRKMLFAWLEKFDVTPRGDMREELVLLADRHALTFDCEPLHRGYAWIARLSREG